MNQPQAFNRPAPLVNIAAITVVVASVLAIAGASGILPELLSAHDDHAPTATPVAPGSLPVAACRQCGRVEALRVVQVKLDGAGFDGGSSGAIVGSQFGQGSSRTPFTLVDGGSGAYAGHGAAQGARSRTSYRVTVRMEDGTTRTVYQDVAPDFAIGDKVKVVNGALAARD